MVRSSIQFITDCMQTISGVTGQLGGQSQLFLTDETDESPGCWNRTHATDKYKSLNTEQTLWLMTSSIFFIGQTHMLSAARPQTHPV